MSDTPAPSTPVSPPTDPTDRAAFWRDTVAAFAASGLSVRAFCEARGLTERKFYTWRKNLGLSPVTRPTPVSETPPRAFVPVRVVADSVAEVTLPDGVTVRVPVSSDPAHVARLVAALRGATC